MLPWGLPRANGTTLRTSFAPHSPAYCTEIQCLQLWVQLEAGRTCHSELPRFRPLMEERMEEGGATSQQRRNYCRRKSRAVAAVALCLLPHLLATACVRRQESLVQG